MKSIILWSYVLEEFVLLTGDLEGPRNEGVVRYGKADLVCDEPWPRKMIDLHQSVIPIKSFDFNTVESSLFVEVNLKVLVINPSQQIYQVKINMFLCSQYSYKLGTGICTRNYPQIMPHKLVRFLL